MSVPGQKGQDSETLVSWLRGTNISLLQVTLSRKWEVVGPPLADQGPRESETQSGWKEGTQRGQMALAPVTGLQTQLFRIRQTEPLGARSVPRTRRGKSVGQIMFFSPSKPMMTLNHVSAPVNHTVSLCVQEPSVLWDEGALYPQAGLGLCVFLLNM